MTGQDIKRLTTTVSDYPLLSYVRVIICVCVSTLQTANVSRYMSIFFEAVLSRLVPSCPVAPVLFRQTRRLSVQCLRNRRHLPGGRPTSAPEKGIRRNPWTAGRQFQGSSMFWSQIKWLNTDRLRSSNVLKQFESCHYLDFDLDLTMVSMVSVQRVSVIRFCPFHPSGRYSTVRLASPTAWASTAGFKSSSFATRTVLIGLRYGNAWRKRYTLYTQCLVSTERTKICQRGRKSRQCLASKMQRRGEKRRYRALDKGIERPYAG